MILFVLYLQHWIFYYRVWFLLEPMNGWTRSQCLSCTLLHTFTVSEPDHVFQVIKYFTIIKWDGYRRTIEFNVISFTTPVENMACFACHDVDIIMIYLRRVRWGYSHLSPTAPPPDLRRPHRVSQLRHEMLGNYVTWPAWGNWNVFLFNWCLYHVYSSEISIAR